MEVFYPDCFNHVDERFKPMLKEFFTKTKGLRDIVKNLVSSAQIYNWINDSPEKSIRLFDRNYLMNTTGRVCHVCEHTFGLESKCVCGKKIISCQRNVVCMLCDKCRTNAQTLLDSASGNSRITRCILYTRCAMIPLLPDLTSNAFKKCKFVFTENKARVHFTASGIAIDWVVLPVEAPDKYGNRFDLVQLNSFQQFARYLYILCEDKIPNLRTTIESLRGILSLYDEIGVSAYNRECYLCHRKDKPTTPFHCASCPSQYYLCEDHTDYCDCRGGSGDGSRVFEEKKWTPEYLETLWSTSVEDEHAKKILQCLFWAVRPEDKNKVYATSSANLNQLFISVAVEDLEYFLK